MEGKMAVISGFSGAGKGTIVRRLLETYPEDYVLSVSKTTRKPRKGEEEGVHYFFVSRERFEDEIGAGKFIEHAEFNGNYYGTPLDWVTAQQEAGKNVILEIEVQGALQVKERFPDAVLIFVTPPSMRELVSRLLGRGSETPEDIRNRLEIAAVRECRLMSDYDYIVINDDLDLCVEDVRSMIAGTYEKTDMTGLIARISDEIQNILESGELKL
ncbi:MAG: guanylate kinase [Lachnospiraceae bacterium]|nr:guanylate kinase [Lachnospiraceae bacterium]